MLHKRDLRAVDMAEDVYAPSRCADCDIELSIGRDTIRVQEGVIGTRGFVDLGDSLVFCSEACLRKHFVDTELVKCDRRIP